MNLQPDMRDPHVQTDDAPPPAAGELRRQTSEELIGPAREMLIRHAGFDYRLRITRQGKLILTK
jgi:hemin uptake protein HemP